MRNGLAPRLPTHLGVIGLGMAGPTIIAHGTEAQKQRYLAKILSGEEIWCQGFSEPGAGSDLSAVRTSAELHDGHFVVSGQKVWSSYAHLADWCILLTRSDPESQRHAGLTYLLVDMHSPGVEVRPSGTSPATPTSTRSSSRTSRCRSRTSSTRSATAGQLR